MQGKIDFLYADFHQGSAYERLDKLVSSVARDGMLAAEVGCFTGKTAFCALPYIKKHGGLMYLIDWFRGCIDSKCVWFPQDFPRNHVLGTLLDNLEAGGFSEHAIVMVGNSIDTARAFTQDQVLDYLYIGADHRYTQFKADVETWWPRVKPGGVMCGHGCDRTVQEGGPDWQKCLTFSETDCLEGVHWGIARLLAERFPDCGVDTGIWWIYKGVTNKGE